MIREKMINFWNDNLSEGINRKAQRQIIKANRLFHKNSVFFKAIALLMHNRNVRRYGCEIYPQATIGENLYIPHCVGIVVGNTAVIGDNCVIFPNVVIGARYSRNEDNPNGRRHAICGNRVVFGANSSIIGDIRIGNDVTIGAGAVVTHDVPDGATVVGHNRILDKREG